MYIWLKISLEMSTLLYIVIAIGPAGICCMYRQVSSIRRTLVGNQIVDQSDVVGASPAGAAPTTSSLST